MATTDVIDADQLADVLLSNRYFYRDELQLHDGLAAVLTAAGYHVEREVPLSGHDRIDLLVGQVGIEVKTSGSFNAVARQLQRYAASDRIDTLVLVTASASHLQLPDQLGGKRLVVASLLRGAL